VGVTSLSSSLGVDIDDSLVVAAGTTATNAPDDQGNPEGKLHYATESNEGDSGLPFTIVLVARAVYTVIAVVRAAGAGGPGTDETTSEDEAEGGAAEETDGPPVGHGFIPRGGDRSCRLDRRI